MENDYLLDSNMEAISPPSSPNNQSPNSFSRDLIGRLGITSQGSETVIYETQNIDNSTSDVVSSLQKADQAIKRELIDPLRQILKDKCKASSKCEFLHSCLAHNTLPKGATPTVPLKIMNAPSDLENKWNNILQDCGRQLTLTLINYHQGQIVELEQLAEETITNGNQIVLPEFITEVPDTPARIENAIQDLLCEITLTNKRLRKRPPSKTTTSASKKAKKTPTITANIQHDEPSTSNATSPPNENTSNNSKKEPKNKNHPWRPLKLKKKSQAKN